MVEYPVVAVLWEDHLMVQRDAVPKNADKALSLTLSLGILYKQTEKTITLVSDIERYDDRDDASFLIILRSTIVSVKEYGRIKIRKLRT